MLHSQSKLSEQGVQLPKHAGGIDLSIGCGDDPNDFFIAEDGKASGRRRGVEREDKHVPDYRAIPGPISPETSVF